MTSMTCFQFLIYSCFKKPELLVFCILHMTYVPIKIDLFPLSTPQSLRLRLHFWIFGSIEVDGSFYSLDHVELHSESAFSVPSQI